MPVVLYEKQRQALEFVAQYIQRNGFAPALREIADAMGLSSLATVHEHMNQLQKKGVLKITGYGKHRHMEVVDKKLADNDTGMKLPVLGFIAEGRPIEPFSEMDVFFSVAPSLLSGKKRALVLKVKGDTFLDEGILDGDFVVIEEKANVEDGELVLALLEKDVVTLKRFFKEETRVRLESIRNVKPPLFVNKIKIQGEIKAIIRKY
ncbi:repressor LexA [Candidatus Beckwithbacteria bacterium CG10_big_fil_rev_8_21_14_0_10_34_10]|uniref:Repressor LexA n=1 Tax=Candidatus Beckwithbacteria bacterium CG10_big_fil_rev_8_21_14_0_10_34_10 TaxID=1974495 RepID=A0A2H0WAE0_9BACT|nr:MAG: repressor LexA [Candidatus Beckwithbacteria bacterium CG10_big_fil_rev_8_21_14_0_10_34_10]